MSNNVGLIVNKLIDDFFVAIKNKDINEIKKIDEKTATLLRHPKLNKKDQDLNFERLNKVHKQALNLIKEESKRVSSSLSEFRNNSDGLRGYFEVSGEL